jgi:hypothetical protein
MRTALLILAAVLLWYLYGISLVMGIGFPMGSIDPPWWERMFASRGDAALVWLSLHHTVAVVLVSLPFSCVLRLIYGRRGVAVAFAITCAVVLMNVPGILETFAHGPMRYKVVSILDQLKLIGALPLLTWAVDKLPSNYRMERRVNHKLPSSSVGARGAHAER